ncbi:anti-sigma-factor antagonist [Actinoplanes sp. SE50]|uniref:STAS domain-containing protein n=1 Tax=unclassified Actinoplanes TaxID=2626549 RepID=UPI00023ED0B8|nr:MULTISPECIES: STAS domain-containing protein [unclassified Actinoplanes]AEV85541.1 anti-sigma-factor antagonist [Actinoplanes sp. SE50/110]ATO83934.1 anti-sigma-factor antagonist [Actinoplanes sp. SE50]SLM01344.1 anti-sigma factor antagonist [Actinoplanes sp. SE50/110]
MTTALTLTTGQQPDGAPLLAAAGEIDMSNADTFAAALSASAPAAGRPLLVDLTAVEYLDSAGLAALFRHADRIEVVTGPLLAPLLAVSGLGDLTTVHSR